MSKRAEFTQIYAYGEVTNNDASLDIIDIPGTGIYIYIEKLYLNVYKAAAGGDGVVRLQDTDGTVYMTVNIDGIKDLSFDFGTYGWKISTANVGLQLVVSGAQTKQGSVSVILKGHLDNK